MDKAYNHKEHEEKIYNTWQQADAFAAKIDKSKQPFSIVMPPPNANDPLHVGHAMFVALEDILIRYHRMLGKSSLWLPGTDHAGIETQFVFEKKLAKQDKSRFDFDRQTLYQKIWDYVEENSGVAIDQMKKLGASADWSTYKFTLDPDIVKLVLETFTKLHKDNLVYRGERLVNYCVKCGTGYSELEVEYEERTDPLFYIKYELVDEPGKFIVVATTRPEPIYVDTHLAVHPKDKKNKHLIGKKVKNPLTDGSMEIIGDEFVDPEFGTGIVKLTPAHDAADFEVASKHNLPIIHAIDTTGRMIGGPSEGKKVGIARTEARQLLEEKGSIEKVDEKYNHRVGTCYRCHSIIEPLPLPQFFIKTKPLAQKALQALDSGETKILGAGREAILRHWLTNIKDWNISRQIVWGIKIPVWYNIDTNDNLEVSFISSDKKNVRGKLNELLEKHNLEEIKSGLQTIKAPLGSEYVVQKDEPTEGRWIEETDTFDTWFSSGQWPVVTLQSNGQEYFDYFYPTTVMETGYDILPIWVMRMMLLCIYTTGKSPFEYVYLHGLARDEQGRKMSKSLGNVINPLDMVDKYGADALRMALVMGSTPGQDKSVGEQTIKGMRNFSNKIWNASRFVKEFTGEAPHNPDFETEIKNMVNEVTKYLDNLRIGLAAEYLYNEFWHSYCDKWIEEAKKGSVGREQMLQGLEVFLKLLHPFVPFVTESCYQQVFAKDEKDLLISQSWPTAS